jgi:signal transduction histidine kinase
MERVLDFTLAPPDTAHERLLACYQAYLGHDLCNQLVPIQAYARLLESSSIVTLGPEERDILARLAELTRRVDLKSRRLAEIGRFLRDPNEAELTSLADVVYEAIALVKSSPRGESTAHSGTKPTFTVVEPMPPMRVSRKLLLHVLVELLHNAWAAFSPTRPGTVILQAYLSQQGIALTVRDNGRGFAESALARVGEFDFNGNSAWGYLLVCEAMARWRGVMKIVSEQDKGTTVELLLPSRVRDESDRERLAHEER